MDKQIKSAKINRITFLIFGLCFGFFAIFVLPFIIVAIILLIMAFLTNKKYHDLINQSKPVEVNVVETPKRDTVKVIDLDGTVREINTMYQLDDYSKVLIAEGGRTYHTSLGCFKKWKTDKPFNGWTIITKEDAINRGLTYCKFCEEASQYTLDDLENEDIDYDLEES